LRNSWLSVALSPPVVRRALGYAVVVGALLIAINHGDAILSGEVSPGRVGKMLLTMMVPYLVSTMSSVGAIRELGGGGTRPAGQGGQPLGPERR
jgi:hypothetical protein